MTRMTSLFGPKRVTLFVTTLSLVVLTTPNLSPAQTTDITSSGLNTQISTPTPLPDGTINYDITGGSRPGNGPNLFHSFGEFSVGADNIANFLNETALPTLNILSRVTGGNPSNIFGTLQTTNFGAANLYLINPAGVMFGLTAELNVGGSVNISTADYLKMTDGAKFYANPAQATVLSIEPVAAFGFLGVSPSGKITVEGGTGAPSLSVQSGKNFSFIGGDISVTGRTLSAPGGQINLASVASAGEVVPNAPGQPAALSLNGFTALGNISLAQGTIIDTSSNAAGPIVLRGGHLVMDGSKIVASTMDGPGGNIDVKVENVELTRFTGINTRTDGVGSAGDVNLDVGSLTATTRVAIGSTTTGTGHGGNTTITARTVTLADDGLVQNFVGSAGNSGNITVTATDSLIISGTGSFTGITTEAFAGATGDSGNVVISAPILQMDGGLIRTLISEGNGGDISITTRTMNMTTSADINTSSSGAGHGGNITVNGAESLTIQGTRPSSTGFSSFASGSGNAGVVTVSVPVLNMEGGSIRADTFAAGRAGNINLDVDTLTAGNLSVISTTSHFTDATAGNAGNITIQGVTGSGSPATHVNLDTSLITTEVSEGSAATTPGAITITAHTLALANAGTIGADTHGVAPAGNIALNVDTLMVGDAHITSTSWLQDTTAGKAGNITIQGVTGVGSPAADVRLEGGISSISTINTAILGGSAATTPGAITITARTLSLDKTNFGADTLGAAPAGNISLNVDTLTVANTAGIDSTSASTDSTAGKAGNITIQGVTGVGNPAATVSLDNSHISTDIFGGSASTTSGAITITAQTLALLNLSGLGISAGTNGTGPAGDITLNVDTLTAGNSTISSSSSSTDSEAGNAGSITIQGINGSGSPAANVSLDHSTISTTIADGTSLSLPATIEITAQTMNLMNSTGLGGGIIQANTSGAAPAGGITLNVGTLAADGLSLISSSSGGIVTGSGNAGNIIVRGAGGPGTLANSVTISQSEISTEANAGAAGSINLASNNIILGSALINSRINGSDISLDSGPQSNITFTAQNLLIQSSTIQADVGKFLPTAKTAGNITFNVGTFTAQSGQNLETISSIAGPFASNAGRVTFNGFNGSGTIAESIHLDHSIISTTVSGGNVLSTPATIDITARTVNLTNGAQIKADTSSAAPGGDTNVKASTLSMSFDSTITSSTLTGSTGRAGTITLSDTGSSGMTVTGGTILGQSVTDSPAGDIAVRSTGDLNLLGTTISVKNTGPGSAGSINILAGNDLLVRNSQVSTESAQASGGDIKLTAPHIIRLVDSTLTSSVQGQAGSDGGNINIDPQLVVIQNSQLLANANAGAGGNINILASGAVLIDPNSALNATAGPAGVSGSVNINAPIQVLSGALVPLTLVYSQAGLSGDRCTADPQGQFSSFVQTGRDGVPQVPGALSPSPLSFLETLTSSSLGSPWPNVAAARLGLNFVSVDDSTRYRFHSACRS